MRCSLLWEVAPSSPQEESVPNILAAKHSTCPVVITITASPITLKLLATHHQHCRTCIRHPRLGSLGGFSLMCFFMPCSACVLKLFVVDF